MSEDEIREKIKRPQHTDITVDSKHSKKGGRRKLEEKGLTDEMMNFAWLIGSGVDSVMAGRKLGFSDYKIRAYLELDGVQDQIVKSRALRTKENLRQWKELDEEIRAKIATRITDLLASKPVLDNQEVTYLKFLFSEWEKKLRAEGLNGVSLSGQKRVTATQTTIEKTNQLTYERSEEKPEEIEFGEDNEEIIELEDKVVEQDEEDKVVEQDEEDET